MRYLDLVTILCTCVMVGNELAVSLFVNPAMRQLEEQPQAVALRLLAGSLGEAMPFWYALGLALIAAEAILRRHKPAVSLLAGAAALWLLVIVFTIAALVPINNRIAALDPANASSGWQQEHHKWDMLHRPRIGALTIAVICLIWGLLGSR
jgi:uncharacterized membrane protein